MGLAEPHSGTGNFCGNINPLQSLPPRHHPHLQFPEPDQDLSMCHTIHQHLPRPPFQHQNTRVHQQRKYHQIFPYKTCIHHPPRHLPMTTTFTMTRITTGQTLPIPTRVFKTRPLTCPSIPFTHLLHTILLQLHHHLPVHHHQPPGLGVPLNQAVNWILMCGTSQV